MPGLITGPFLGKGFNPSFADGITAAADKYLPMFEKILTKSGTGYLYKNAMNMADVCLFEVLLLVEEELPGKMANYEHVTVCWSRFSMRISTV